MTTKTKAAPIQIKTQTVGKVFITIIERKKYSLQVDKTAKDLIKKEIEAFNTRNTKTRLDKILALLTPKKEAAKTLAVVVKKKLHRDRKATKASLLETKKELSSVSMDATLDAEGIKVLSKLKDFLIKDGNLYLKPFVNIRMPKTLVDRVIDFVKADTSLDPLINFWKLALLNPNEIARTKLFDYLSRQNITLTPRGYIVTYRMVKKTDRKSGNGDTIYTSARTGKEDYIMGTAYSLPRTECDEDGGRDCSKGLHTGTHKFIGIIADKKDLSGLETNGSLGEGYGKGVRITTKRETHDSYGTSYDNPRSIESKQNFDHSFGNQAVICLVNPMHVVSIPDSDTRKMRSSELYFCKTTTAEEVIDLVEQDYHIFDHAYYQYELEEINKMLKASKLKEYIDNVEVARTVKKKQLLETRLEELNKSLIINKDVINTNQLNLSDIYNIVKSRVIKVKLLK